MLESPEQASAVLQHSVSFVAKFSWNFQDLFGFADDCFIFVTVP